MLGRGRKADTDIGDLSAKISKLAELTAETNKILKQLAQDNAQFLSTLTSFLAHEDIRRMRREAKEEEDALSKTPTKYDAIY